MIGTEDHPFPAWLSFHLNNGLRRHFHPPRKIVDALGVKATDTLLDFGCGPGFYTIPFAKVASQVVAVDIQPKMLRKLSKYAEKNKVIVKTAESNGESISLPDGCVDLIFLSGVYHELAEKTKVLAELKRVLKPGGRIVIRERTEKGHFSLGPPAIDPNEVFTNLRAAGFAVLASATDPTETKASLMTATA